MAKKYLALVSFCCLLAVVGVAQGVYSYRWKGSAELADRVQRLQRVPLKFGDWEAIDIDEKKETDAKKEALDEATLRVGGISGYFSKAYKSTKTEKTVQMLIVCGRFGPISRHTPDVCYAGAGFKAIGDQVSKRIPQSGLSVWALKFNPPPSSGKSPIEVNWAWDGGDGWIAPDYTRWTFVGYSSLYKIYVVRSLLPSPDANDNDDPSASFMQSALPELEKLFSSRS